MHGNCPKCDCPLEADSVDIGVGIQYGPPGCPRCGWGVYQETADSLGQQEQAGLPRQDKSE